MRERGRVRRNLDSSIQGAAEATGMILFDTTVIANLTATASAMLSAICRTHRRTYFLSR